MPDPTHYINNHWVEGSGETFASIDPTTAQPSWQGRAASAGDVDRAVNAAREAASSWASISLENRIAFLHAFAEQLKKDKESLADAICRSTGKPRWESHGEVDLMINKIPVSIDAYRDRRKVVERDAGNATLATRYKPHGVLAVFGPFNMPGHLPNGHIVPALLAGNTIVFKPSEQTPLVAQKMLEAWQAVNLPPGVLNLVQGGRDTGIALANHPQIDGLLFTGSYEVGSAINQAFAKFPQKLLALEMGGNNPLIVHQVADLDAAAYLTIQSAFITAGQRCTCARRLILPDGNEGDELIDRLSRMMQSIRVGPYAAQPEPFMGPVISSSAAAKLLAAHETLRSRGGKSIVEMKRIGDSPAMLSPGLIDTTGIDQPDVEIFGPLLRVIRVKNFDHALREANNTAYGLSAGLFSDDRALWEMFYRAIRAGVVNWNREITGASGQLPFGGIGRSGNFRPSGYWAADYCSYPVASIEIPKLSMPAKISPGISM